MTQDARKMAIARFFQQERRRLTQYVRRRVETVEAEEGAAYGAAILAGVGAQAWPSVDAACEAVVRVAGNTSPHSADSLAMGKAYKVYTRIYPAMKSILGEQLQYGE